MESRPRIATRRTQPSFVVRGLFGLGVPELAVIAGVAALLFGPKQLPQIGKKLGQTVTSFQQVGIRFTPANCVLCVCITESLEVWTLYYSSTFLRGGDISGCKGI